MLIDAARAKSLFLAASELQPALRPAYLDGQCGDNADLRARVEALLRADQTMAATEATDAAGPETDEFRGPVARIGTILAGRYKLIETIGEGGMGSVFMAQQTEPVKRIVAVKVIKAGMDSKAVLARFEAERQALAMMDHPSIAKVLDAGTTHAGHPFFVMELVKGVPITRYCDEHKLTLHQRLELFVPVCQAIQHAHQKGIIHRDIKPSNVLVATYDDRPVPKVIDFGVAKAAGQNLTEQTLITGFAALVGTPEYMSPEQASMNNLDIDTRSDVYSLGVLLYELLTGATPVDRKSLGKAAILEVLRIVREAPVPHLSTRLSTIATLPSVAANRGTEPTKLSRLMRGELDWLVMKALEKDRTRRYDTANALARDIQRYLADELVEARPPSAGYRLTKFVRRHKGQVIAASLVVLLLVGGIAGTTWGLFEATQQEKEAKNQAQIARVETTEKQHALAAEALRGKERDIANDQLKHQLGVSAMVLANAAFDDSDFALATERLAKVPDIQRGWEWNYLTRQMQGGIYTLNGQIGPVTCVAFSPDGTRILTGSGGQNEPFEAKVRDAATGLFLFELKGLPLKLQGANIPTVCVAYSADGKRIVTAGGDESARVWDAKTGALQLALTETTGEEVTYAAFSPDGARIATAYRSGDKGIIQLWDAATGKSLFEWRAHGIFVTNLAFSPDGTRILSGGMDQAVRVWDARTGTLLFEAKGMTSPDSRVAWSPDGRRIVAGQDDATARVIDAQTGGVLLEVHGRTFMKQSYAMAGSGVLAASFSPDGSRIVTCGGINNTGEASVWDAHTGAELLQLKGHTGLVMSAAFSPDGTKIITGSADGTAKVWDARTATPRLELSGITGSIQSVAISPDGTWIVAAGGGDRSVPGRATIWDARSGTPRLALEGFKQSVNCVSISPDGTKILTGGGGEYEQAATATLWDARTGAVLFQLNGAVSVAGLRPLLQGVTCVAFSPDGSRIATGGGEAQNEVKLWDANTGMHLHDLAQPSPESEFQLGNRVCVAFSPDGKRLLVGGRRTVTGGALSLWDANTGAFLRDVDASQSGICCVAFSPDGHMVVSGDTDSTAKVFDADTGAILADCKGHTGDVTCVAFSPDNSRIVTGSGDRTVRIWDVQTGTTLAELKGHTSRVTGVAFSRDGQRIVTSSEGFGAQPEVFVWEAPAPVPVVKLEGGGQGVSFSPDSTRIVVGGPGKTVKVCDTQTGATLLTLTGHAADVRDAVFSPDGTRIGTCDDTAAKIWDPKTGAVLFNLKVNTGTFTKVAFSPDGTRFATGGGIVENGNVTGAATIWDAQSGIQLTLIKGLSTSVNRLAFSPDDTRIFIGTQDGDESAWDARTGKEIKGETIPPVNQWELTSPDGRIFARRIGGQIELVPLVPNAAEIAYRRLHMEPNVERYQAEYLAARAAKDDFAAAFFLKLIPTEQRKEALDQADAAAFAALTKLSQEYQQAGKLTEAIPLFAEILKDNNDRLGPDNRATLISALKLARLYNQTGQPLKAIPALQAVVANGNQDGLSLTARDLLAHAYMDAGRMPEALAVLDAGTEKGAWKGAGLLDFYERGGEQDKIIAFCLKTLAENQNVAPREDLLARLGRAYMAQNNCAQAEAPLRECLALRQKSAPDEWAAYEAQSLLGGALLGQNKFADAEPLLLAGYAGMMAREMTIPPQDRHFIPDTLGHLINLYASTNKLDEAKKWQAQLTSYLTQAAPKGP